jgi:hypothetical protein
VSADSPASWPTPNPSAGARYSIDDSVRQGGLRLRRQPHGPPRPISQPDQNRERQSPITVAEGGASPGGAPADRVRRRRWGRLHLSIGPLLAGSPFPADVGKVIYAASSVESSKVTLRGVIKIRGPLGWRGGHKHRRLPLEILSRVDGGKATHSRRHSYVSRCRRPEAYAGSEEPGVTVSENRYWHYKTQQYDR